MSGSSSSRRGFLTGLRQLATLPLVGGSVTLIGEPARAAVPITDHLLHSYKCWLHYEHRMLSHELAAYGWQQADDIEHAFWTQNAGARWHFRAGFSKAGGSTAGWETAEQPSERAALVLSAVGCDWRRRNGG